jgi:hypothetical protein
MAHPHRACAARNAWRRRLDTPPDPLAVQRQSTARLRRPPVAAVGPRPRKTAPQPTKALLLLRPWRGRRCGVGGVDDFPQVKAGLTAVRAPTLATDSQFLGRRRQFPRVHALGALAHAQVVQRQQSGRARRNSSSICIVQRPLPRIGSSAAMIASWCILAICRRPAISPAASRRARSRSARALLPDTPQTRRPGPSIRAKVSACRQAPPIAASTRPTMVAAALPLSGRNRTARTNASTGSKRLDHPGCGAIGPIRRIHAPSLRSRRLSAS